MGDQQRGSKSGISQANRPDSDSENDRVNTTRGYGNK